MYNLVILDTNTGWPQTLNHGILWEFCAADFAL